MTEIDPELRDKIIETHTDMKHVRKQLDAGKETFEAHDKRIRELEQNHSKLVGITLAVGAGITIVLNGVLWLAGKIWK